jgi:hypothetical protein
VLEGKVMPLKEVSHEIALDDAAEDIEKKG